jgi:hypothetical protein
MELMEVQDGAHGMQDGTHAGADQQFCLCSRPHSYQRGCTAAVKEGKDAPRNGALAFKGRTMSSCL